MSSLLDAALGYGARGWPVIPLHGWTGTACTCGHADCGSPAKHPKTKNGLKDAATDEHTIRSWWGRWPQANIGLRTGIAFDALDIDGDEGFDAAQDAENTYGSCTSGPTSNTGGGGMHQLYAPTGIGNRAGIIPHVDWRGVNGYIVAPPSMHASGRRYEWTEICGPDTPIEPVRGWLYDLLFPPTPIRRAIIPASETEEIDRYVRRAVDSEIGELIRTPEGSRNDALNRAAFNLYQFVGSGAAPETDITNSLTRAAIGMGLGEHEIMVTLESARKAGVAQPRHIPKLRVVAADERIKPPSSIVHPIEEVPEQTDDDTTPSPVSLYDHEIYEFINQVEPDYQWIIPDIAEAGDRIILTGPEGGGKSTLLRQVAIQVAAGIHPFTHNPIEPRRTLIIDLENGRRHLRRSLRPLVQTPGDQLAVGMARVISLPSGIDLIDGRHVEWLNRRFDIDRPELVVIGPIYKMANGNPNDEEIAKKVAYVIDDLRTRYDCCFLIEAHQPYAAQGSNRPERPYGASLWSRWPEFGLHLSISGDLRHWRGDRDERAWPKTLTHGTPWPWIVDDSTDTEEAYDGPSHCRDAVAFLLSEFPAEEFSLNSLMMRLRAKNKSYRKETISVAAEQLADAGSIIVRSGPRNSRLFSYGGTRNA